MKTYLSRKLSAGLVLALAVHGLFFANVILAGESPQERLAKAEAMFQERCKAAGERIVRTVDNVEAVYLLKVRPTGTNFGDQFKLDDPYGNDSGGESYIKTFFSGFYPIPAKPSPKWRRRLGYKYVEALSAEDGKRYRYIGSIKDVSHVTSVLMGGDGKTTFVTKDFVLDKSISASSAPRYGITYEDISTREEREYWISGSSLKIVDLQSNEAIAERVGYMMDRGQGNISGGRSPWLLASYFACPAFPVDPGGHPIQVDQTREFVVRVLRPTQEN